MAVMELWRRRDLEGAVKTEYIDGNFFTQDSVGNLVGVKVYSNGAEVALTGSVTGYCVLPSGETVSVAGTRSGNQASILVPQSALAYTGPLGITLKLIDGNTITTLMRIIVVVYRSKTDTVITPSSQIITDWANQISAALQEVEDASAAQDEKIDDLKSALDVITSKSVAIEDGMISYATGAVVPPSGDAEKVTDFIFAPSGSIVKFSYFLSAAHYREISIAGYNAQKILVSRIAIKEGDSFSTDTIESIIPDGIKFVRICFKTFGDFDTYSLYVVLNIENIDAELSESILNKVDGITGKNLFDVSGKHTQIVKNYYRMYSTGNWAMNNEYDTAILSVIPETKYSVSHYNCHVCFYSDKDATVYISGFLTNIQNGKTFTTPAEAVSMSVSYSNASENDFMVERNETPTPYESFRFGINSFNIIGTIDGMLLTVGINKKFQTIQEAVNAASNGDTILIDPGIYVEAVDVVSSGKYLHFIGSGRNSTIVQFAGDDYYYPPLEIAKGIVEHMSFITTATQKAEGAIDTAYCVHIDYDAEANNSLQFVDCYFESPIRPTVGIGLRENFTLNFTNCKFKSSVYPVYCHEQQANNKTGQRIELINCSIQCTGAMPAIHLQESRAYTGNEVTILMQRCIVKANGVSGNNIISAVTYPNNQPPTGSNYLNLNSFYLDIMSALNNESILNA